MIGALSHIFLNLNAGRPPGSTPAPDRRQTAGDVRQVLGLFEAGDPLRRQGPDAQVGAADAAGDAGNRVRIPLSVGPPADRGQKVIRRFEGNYSGRPLT